MVGSIAVDERLPRPGRRGARRRLVGIALAALLALSLGGLGGVGWVASERALHPEPETYPWSLADYPDLRFESVTFPSRTGIELAGRFFPGERRATIVLSHGFGDNQDQMLPWVRFLHDVGFSVFTYDMRARGASGGRDVTLGALEQVDLVSAVDYLVGRPDVDPERIGALGVSLGGATSIMAAAQDPRIKAVVDDSGFSDAPGVIETSFEHFIGIPAFPFAPVSVQIAEWRAGVEVTDIRPMDVIGQISPRPVLIIHGTDDLAVPPEHSQRNFERAGEPKELWWVPGAGHNEARVVAGEEYQRKVVAFFRHAFGD